MRTFLDELIIHEMQDKRSRLTLDEKAEKLNLLLAQFKRYLIAKHPTIETRHGMLVVHSEDELDSKLDAEQVILDQMLRTYEGTVAFLDDLRKATETAALAGAIEEKEIMQEAARFFLEGLQKLQEANQRMTSRRGLVSLEQNDFRLAELAAKEQGSLG